MSDDNVAENSPSLQLPDVLVPLLWEDTYGAVFVTWPLPRVYLTARTGACFKIEPVKQMRALLLNKIT